MRMSYWGNDSGADEVDAVGFGFDSGSTDCYVVVDPNRVDVAHPMRPGVMCNVDVLVPGHQRPHEVSCEDRRVQVLG